VQVSQASETERALGIDAAGRFGWLGVVVDGRGYVAAGLGSLREVIAWAEPVASIGVDIPIGSVAGGVRRADVEARRFVRPLGSSVFAAPPAEALVAPSYAEANAALAARGAAMMSRQAWALVSRMVEALEVAGADDRVREVHPEVSFRQLADVVGLEPLRWSKKSWNGLLGRRNLLAATGIHLPDVIPELAGAVGDDVVDAAVVAWSARRIANGESRTFPNPPEEREGRQVAIWC
jgi:predicted RNase H-like nuclease